MRVVAGSVVGAVPAIRTPSCERETPAAAAASSRHVYASNAVCLITSNRRLNDIAGGGGCNTPPVFDPQPLPEGPGA